MTKAERLRARLVEALREETRREVVHWSGQPSRRAAFWHAFPIFAVALVGVAVFIFIPGEHVAERAEYLPDGLSSVTWEEIRQPAIFLPLFMVLPVVICCVPMMKPFWAARRAARRIHAITNKRLITIVAGRDIRVESIKLAELKHVKAWEWRNGAGELSVIRDYENEHLNVDWEAIPDVRKLEELVLKLSPSLRDD
jgi:hypothetical protein